jgi:hypothetical protein
MRKRGEPLPELLAARFKGEAQATTAENLRAALECKRLHEAFTKARLPLLFVKGLTLSKMAYGSASLKMSRDVDLLVLPEQVAEAGRLLRQLGYRPQLAADPARLTRWHRWSKESGWIGTNGLLVELHGRLTDNSRLLPMLRSDGPHQLVSIAPGISLPTLRDEHLISYLAVHGASSAWFRLKWLVDLHALLAGADAQRIGAVHSAMRALGAGRAAGQAMLLLHLVYDVPLPDDLARALKADRIVHWLTAEALRQMAAPTEPTERRGGTLGIHATQLMIGEHWTYPLSEGLRRAGEIIARRLTAG